MLQSARPKQSKFSHERNEYVGGSNIETRHFLSLVASSYPEGGYLHVAVIPINESRPYHHWIDYPEQLDQLEKLVADKRADHNIFFSPHLYSHPDTELAHRLPSRTLVVDVDTTEIGNLPLKPSIVVQTSDSAATQGGSGRARHQVYWFLKADVSLDVLEAHNRALAFSIPDADRSSWPLGHLVRLPGTLNHKYIGQTHEVEVVSQPLTRYDPADLELLPQPSSDALDIHQVEFIENPPAGDAGRKIFQQAHLLDFKPRDAKPDAPPTAKQMKQAESADEVMLLWKQREKIASVVYQRFNRPHASKAAAQWELIRGLFRAGASRNDVFWIAWHSANNPYTGQLSEVAGWRELAKDVLRGEALARTHSQEPREAIMRARRQGGFAPERKAHLFNLMLDLMKREGDFIRTSDQNIWYIPRASGRPIPVERHSELMNMVLDIRFGINSSESDHLYVCSKLRSYGLTLPTSAQHAALSWFDKESNHVILHTGKKETIIITPDSITKSVNGAHNLVFPWPPTVEPFSPILADIGAQDAQGQLWTRRTPDDGGHPERVHWSDVLFGDALDHVTNLSKAEAQAIMTVWFMFLLMRASSVARPIVALLGQPGSGKSTMFRRVYAFLYGRTRSLNSVTKREDFDYAVATDPLVVLDNVDTWERWLPDSLALAAAAKDNIMRKFYTQSEVVVLKSQALVALTAHNPQFGRPDVADRLLILNLERLPHFRPEGDLLHRIYSMRNYMWGQICYDLQKVLNTPFPKESECPQFRIEDFSRNGCWIARGMGGDQLYHDFTSALKRIQQSQRRFVLEDDNVLVEAFHNLLQKRKGGSNGHGPSNDDTPTATHGDTGWVSPGVLWQWLETSARDLGAFKAIYRNAPTLAKRLVAMKEPLKEAFQIDMKPDPATGSRLWRIQEVIKDKAIV